MRREDVIAALEAIIVGLKVGSRSGQEVGQASGLTGPYKDSYIGKEVSKEVSKEESSKKEPIKNLTIEAHLPTATLPTSCVADRGPRGTRLSEEWEPHELGLKYAREKGLSDTQIDEMAQHFKGHFLSTSGKTAIKRDWSKAWEVWVLKSIHQYGLKPAAPSPTTTVPTLSDEKRAELLQKFPSKYAGRST